MSSKKQVKKTTLSNKQRTVQHLDLENALLEWVLQNQDNFIISDGILIEKAKTFAKLLKIPESNFKFSYRWLFKFKKKHGLEQLKKHGEDASVDDNQVTIAISQLREVLKEYNLKDIYNMDETGLFYRLSVMYESSSKACMMTVLFQAWLKEFDVKMANRKYESGNDDKLNVLNAIKFIVQVCNCFWHTGTLPVIQNNEEPTNDNDDELIEEMKADIEALNFRNAIDLENYINYPEEEDTNEILDNQEILTLVTNIEPEDLNDDNSEDKDDSREIPLIVYHEALNAIKVLNQHLIQQNLSDKAQLDHILALLNLQKTIRKSRRTIFKQVNLEAFFQVDN
ncbi:7626_t:CDS:2 [Dentiscutata erythropus]|uniref:7626_t:CDS:1 n=1 Tax=Dentiscutata erythropus TaxID=1348616 RepID=A0A9N9GDY6_9GLOM|nr:7626_t:CDS:2 [Dentiscutata erythropus]